MTTYQSRGVISRVVIGGAIVSALIVGGTIGVLLTRTSHPAAPPRTSGGSPRQPSSSTSAATSPAFTVASVSPTAGAVGVPGGAPVTVTFSSPPATSSPMPSLSPTTPGTWSTSGDVLTFTPTTAFTPLTEVTLTIPGGSQGVVAGDGQRLAQSSIEHFRVMNGSVLRLQQLLSLLDYSPLDWTPTAPPIASNDLSAQSAALYSPPAGAFSWRNRGWPRQLRAQWAPGEYNVFTRGLVMSFQADHGLATNGHVGPGLWTGLVGALGANTVNTGGYNYALADKAPPQSLTIFHDGRVVLRSPANTGITGSPTPDGTFPVNTRLRQQVMRGTNPNGQRYADLVRYIAYFHGNDAVHYMDRADYGIPQSLGCIELPLADAARAWPYLAYGTLVSVIN